MVVAVDARMAGKLVGATKSLLAEGKGADEGLLAGVCANVAGLGHEKSEQKETGHTTGVLGAQDD